MKKEKKFSSKKENKTGGKEMKKPYVLHGIKGTKGDINKVSVIFTDSLYRAYDFTKNETSFEELISGFDVDEIRKKNFIGIKYEIIKSILRFAEYCDPHPGFRDYNFNFIVVESGRIYIGGNMLKIKENLESIKQDFNAFQKREHYNIVEIELK